jgi:hypothetical protein
MNNFIKYLFIPGLLLFYSCEDAVVGNDLSYEERLVVRGLLVAGEPIEVTFERTLPLDQPFDSIRAQLSDVTAFITHNDVIDTLKYAGAGKYRTSSMISENGEEYQLSAEWNDKSLTGETRVPFTTTFQNGNIITEVNEDGDTVHYIQGLLTPREGAVYGATWVILDPLSGFHLEDNVIPVLLRESDKDLNNRLTLKTRVIPDTLYAAWHNYFYIRVHAFDEEFYNFFITQDANNASSNIFSQSGINLRWNVEGDGIGMFIGESDFYVKVF